MTHPDNIWIGIDIGTQSVRVMAVDDDGSILATGSSPLANTRHDRRHEQDPNDWWDALGRASRQATRDLAHKDRIRALCVCGTSGTVLMVNARGEALTPGLMYDDTRATIEAGEANAHGRALWERLGYGAMQTVWGLPKWMWLTRHRDAGEPAFFAQQVDFITSKLAGRRTAADLSNALKSGCDTIDGCWDSALMARLGLAADRLPELVRPGIPIGTVSPAAADHTGLPEGVVIVAGMTDGCAAQLGAGATGTGDWNSVLGTTLVLKGKSPGLIHDPRCVVYSHRAPDGGWLPGGASSAGAGAFARILGADADLAKLAADAQVSHDEPAVLYPLASSRGERFPFIAPDASLEVPASLEGDPAAQFRALAFGIAAVERLCFDCLDAGGFPIDGSISLTGGGSKNPFLNKLRATMLGRQLVIPAVSEPALGMALLASTIGRPIAEATRRMISVNHRVDPQPAIRARANSFYIRFIDTLQARGWLTRAVADFARERAAA